MDLSIVSNVTQEPTTTQSLLNAAKVAKKDEYYTQWVDIERDVKVYKRILIRRKGAS